MYTDDLCGMNLSARTDSTIPYGVANHNCNDQELTKICSHFEQWKEAVFKIKFIGSFFVLLAHLVLMVFKHTLVSFLITYSCWFCWTDSNCAYNSYTGKSCVLDLHTNTKCDYFNFQSSQFAKKTSANWQCSCGSLWRSLSEMILFLSIGSIHLTMACSLLNWFEWKYYQKL